MRTKPTLFILFLFCLFQTSLLGQFVFVDKKFDSEKEWKLTFKIGDAYASDSYNYCSRCMDELLTMTDHIDVQVLRMGVKCYDKTFQKNKIEKLIKEGYLDRLSQYLKCNLDLSQEVKSMTFFKGCEGDVLRERDVVTDEVLRDKLINMLIADQYYRSVSINSRMYELGYEVHNEYLENSTRKHLDSLNQIQLKEILLEKFPTRKEVGKWGMNAIFLIIQHADLSYQLKYEAEITKGFEEGALNAYNYATMIDRLEINKGNQQIYGTQSNAQGVMPIFDFENVDKRRMAIGLIPFKKELLLFNNKYVH